MKIGITCADESKIWNNGLHQNAYNLFKLYKKLKIDVSLVSQKSESKKVFDDKIIFLTKENLKKFDIILEISEALTDENYRLLLDNNKKIVSINYGNLLMVFNENLITNNDPSFVFSRPGVHNWYSPHFYFSEGLVRSTSGLDGKIAPYIWNPNFLLESAKKYNFDIKDASKNLDLKKIAILEPNINIIKTCIYPIIGCEILEKKDSSKISQIMTFSTDRLKTSKTFLEIIKKFEVLQNKKISFESRYSFPSLLKNKYFGLIVSNNIYNDLNYLTLESLYLNIPIVHNSKMCMEAGYFYESPFDGKKIAENIELAIDSFELSKEKYKESASLILWKYSSENPDNINIYRDLLNSIY